MPGPADTTDFRLGVAEQRIGHLESEVRGYNVPALWAKVEGHDIQLEDVVRRVETAEADIAALEIAVGGGGGGGGASFAVNVKDAGAIGDGVADDKGAIEAAFATAKGLGFDLVFPPGIYRVSAAPILEAPNNMAIYGHGATILFPSSDVALTGTAAYDSVPSRQRSGMYIRNGVDVTIRGLKFQGDSVQTSVSINIGVAVSLYKTTRARLTQLVQYYGGGLVDQADQVEDTDTVVSWCKSYGSRVNSRLGSNGVFHACYFELPTDVGYDRVGNDGSSHAIYFFAASGDFCVVSDCFFKNIRLNPVKFSGSASPLLSYIVKGCTFYKCGPVLFGADDVQTHAVCLINSNIFFDSPAAASVYGSRAVQFSNNIIYFSVAPSPVPSATLAIARYTNSSEPVEDIIVSNNIWSSGVASGGTVATNAMQIDKVGLGISGRTSSVKVIGNFIGNGYTQAIAMTYNVAPEIAFNTIQNVVTAMNLSGCRMPHIHHNRILDQRSSNAQIRHSFCAFPIIHDNIGGGRMGALLSPGRPGISDGNGGSSVYFFPLLGKIGRFVPSQSKPEIVLAYGALWTDGDTVNLNGTNTFTYKTTAPGANEFNSIAGLIALIEGLANYEAADYGAPWGVTTNHIRIRFATAQTVANYFYLKTTCANPTAGVHMINNAIGSNDRTYSRGEGANRAVVWSPCGIHSQVPIVVPENEAAAISLASQLAYGAGVDALDYASSVTMQFGFLSGQELFQWNL